MKRWLLIVLVLGSMLLYIPVNRLISGGYNLEQPIDQILPLIALFVIPYLFGLFFWISTILYVNLKFEKRTAITFDLKIILASAFSVLIYIVIPTFVTRPQITGTDIFSNLLNLVYSNDRTYNAAPSGHTFYTILCLLTLNNLFPKYKWLWVVLSTLIILSTLFTKQHNVLDILFGIIFALVVHILVEKIKFGIKRSI